MPEKTEYSNGCDKCGSDMEMKTYESDDESMVIHSYLQCKKCGRCVSC